MVILSTVVEVLKIVLLYIMYFTKSERYPLKLIELSLVSLNEPIVQKYSWRFLHQSFMEKRQDKFYIFHETRIQVESFSLMKSAWQFVNQKWIHLLLKAKTLVVWLFFHFISCRKFMIRWKRCDLIHTNVKFRNHKRTYS